MKRWLRLLAAGVAGLVAAVAWPARAQTIPESVTPVPIQAIRRTRDASLWPFAADSPWNLGVGSGAQFAPLSDPRTASLIRDDIWPWVNADTFSHPVYRATLTDPMATVHDDRNANPDAQYRIPLNAAPSAGNGSYSDADLHVVDPTDRWVDESWSMRKQTATYWLTGYHQRVDLHGSGMDNGVRAASVSALGGLVRQWELDQGEIRHALALALDSSQMRRGPVWPAKTEDWANGDYAGALPMGTFVAVPPGVDLSALNLSRAGLVMARALQRYGAYVVDTAGAFSFYAEPGTAKQDVDDLRNDVRAVRALLRVVANNGPQSVNGGGSYTVPPPPPFG